MKLRDLKIGTKLIGSFVILLGFMLAIGFYCLISLNDVKRAGEEINGITEAQYMLAQARQDSLKLIYTALPVHGENTRSDLAGAMESADGVLDMNRKTRLYSSEVEDTVMELRNAQDDYWEALEGIEDANRVMEELFSAMVLASQNVDEPLNELEGFVVNLTEEAFLRGDAVLGRLLLTQNLVHIYDMSAAWEKMDGIMLAYMANSTEDNLAAVNRHLDGMEGYFDRALEIFTTDTAKGIIRGVKTSFVQYEDEVKAYVAAVESKNGAVDMAVLAGQHSALYGTEAKAVLEGVVAVTSRRAVRYTLVFTFCAMLISLFLALIITRNITVAVVKSMSYAQSLAEGDFSVSLDVKQNDEIGKLGDALEDMVERVRKVLGHIQQSSIQVTGASGQISASAQAISVGATEQASSMEEVSSSLEELGSSIQQNAENADKSNRASKDTALGSQEGVEAVRETVDAMKEIGERISVIEDIARNTNMLALNAAIEAARAGDAGKGFAVVASEVRKLAESSGAAAKDITEITKENMIKAERALEKIEDIVPSMNLAAELSDEIALSSQEQSNGAAQINQAVTTLDQVVQQNAGASEELASMSEELAAQAESMNQAVSFFRLGDTHSHGEDRVEIGNLDVGEKDEPLMLADGTDGDFEEF
ncbi:MAG: methyl-accepting chemotaxis protein [Spirochaetales bacterium]|nr:methyl-accepting chemotaxis protein [Spirochaetales bacterium]